MEASPCDYSHPNSMDKFTNPGLLSYICQWYDGVSLKIWLDFSSANFYIIGHRLH